MNQTAIHFPPASRLNDPASSKAAEQRITRSGGRLNQADVVLAALLRAVRVTSQPGATSHELTQFCSLNNAQITRRMNDLKQEGRVHKGQPRRCRVLEQKLDTWQPGPAPQPEAQQAAA